jgi:signal recognition particle receptor subunit beta
MIDEDFISGFLSAILDISHKIGGGEIRSLNFKNFNINYSYDDEKYCIFILIADIYDPEEEIRENLKLLKKEFIKRYYYDLKNWDSDVSKFEAFDEFVKNHIFIPPKIILTGEEGVGKTTIMNLFPEELIIDIDEDLNEIIQKTIELYNFENIKECTLIEINTQDLVDHPKVYNHYLNAVEIICLVTNSGASNLGRTKKLFQFLKPRVEKADFYILANFQDLENASFKPDKIEESFGLKTFGISAISEKANDIINSIIYEMLNKTINKERFYELHL